MYAATTTTRAQPIGARERERERARFTTNTADAKAIVSPLVRHSMPQRTAMHKCHTAWMLPLALNKPLHRRRSSVIKCTHTLPAESLSFSLLLYRFHTTNSAVQHFYNNFVEHIRNDSMAPQRQRALNTCILLLLSVFRGNLHIHSFTITHFSFYTFTHVERTPKWLLATALVSTKQRRTIACIWFKHGKCARPTSICQLCVFFFFCVYVFTKIMVSLSLSFSIHALVSLFKLVSAPVSRFYSCSGMIFLYAKQLSSTPMILSEKWFIWNGVYFGAASIIAKMFKINWFLC